MPEPPRATVEIRNFPGLADNMDPDDTPPGTAQVQLNATSHKGAQLTVRRGVKLVRFEDQDD